MKPNVETAVENLENRLAGFPGGNDLCIIVTMLREQDAALRLAKEALEKRAQHRVDCPIRMHPVKGSVCDCEIQPASEAIEELL